MRGLFCWLGFHQLSPGELSYDPDTKEISLHCKSCQKAIGKVENERQLTDEQYTYFKLIFEDF